MGGLLRLAWLGAVVVLLALAGCGTAAPDDASSTPPSSAPQPSASSSAPAGRATGFSSPQLGVSFRYPSDWQLTPAAPFDAQGNASVSLMNPDRKGGLTLLVSAPAAATGKQPSPFRDATPADLDMAVQSCAPEAEILASKLVRLDGLRLAEVEYVSGPSALGNEPRTHAIYFASGFAADGSQVIQRRRGTPRVEGAGTGAPRDHRQHAVLAAAGHAVIRGERAVQQARRPDASNGLCSNLKRQRAHVARGALDRIRPGGTWLSLNPSPAA